MSDDLREAIARALIERYPCFDAEDEATVQAVYDDADAVLAVLPTDEALGNALGWALGVLGQVITDDEDETENYAKASEVFAEWFYARRVAAVPAPPAACPSKCNDGRVPIVIVGGGYPDPDDRTAPCSDLWHAVPPEEG